MARSDEARNRGPLREAAECAATNALVAAVIDCAQKLVACADDGQPARQALVPFLNGRTGGTRAAQTPIHRSVERSRSRRTLQSGHGRRVSSRLLRPIGDPPPPTLG